MTAKRKPPLHAIILAGGLGSRMEPWRSPKCLLPVNGVPILYHLISHLRKYPVSVGKITVCTGYRAKDVEAALHYVSYDYVPTSYLPPDAGMCARIEKAAGRDRVLVCYGDELADVHVGKLYQEHNVNSADITFTEYRVTVPYGVRETVYPDQSVIRAKDLPMNIGFMVMEPRAVKAMLPLEGLATFVARYAQQQPGARVRHFTHHGKRVSVNSIPEWQQAEETWR